MRSTQRSGFTLAELLLVISISAVLAGLVLPVYVNARQGGLKATCFSNERNIGMSLTLYTDDWDAKFPNFRFWPVGSDANGDMDKNSWRSKLNVYVRSQSLFVCPANPSSSLLSNDPTFRISYAANVAFSPRDYPVMPPPLDSLGSGVFGKDLSSGVPTSRILQPAQCIAVVEIYRAPDSLFVVDIADDVGKSYDRYSDCLFTGHSGLSNYLFVDAHVKSLKPTATYHGNDTNFWYRDGSPLGEEARHTLTVAESRQN